MKFQFHSITTHSTHSVSFLQLLFNRSRVHSIALFAIVLLAHTTAWTQIAQFNFPAASSLVVSAKDPNVMVSNFSLSAGTIETNITTGTYFPNEPYVEETGGWTATSQNTAKNFTFTITAASGYQFTITNISFRAYATNAGPSAFGFAVGTTSIYNTNAPDGSLVTVNQAVSGQTNLTSAAIKIQGWLNGSRTSAGSGAFRLDDVIITGTVSLISAPTLAVATKTITGTYPNYISGGESIVGSTIDQKGILWSTTTNPTLVTNDVGGSYVKQATSNGTGTADFQSEFAALTPGTTYFYRAYVVDNGGNVAYGNSLSFTVPAISGSLLAFWNFGPNAAGYSSAFTYKNPAVTGSPTLTQTGGTTDANGKDGVDYLNGFGTSSRGQGMAWNDAKNGTTAQWTIDFNTTNFEDLHLRADYKLQTAGGYTLSYNSGAGWVPITTTGNLLANNIDNDFNWGTIYHNLSAIAAIENAASVQLRFTINDVSGGANDELIIDNIELVGTCIAPAPPSASFNYSPSNPACGNITLTYTGSAAPAGTTYYWQTTSTGTSTLQPASNAQLISATGYRWLRALNSCGSWSTAAQTAQLVVATNPIITTQPSNQSTVVGVAATFSVTASNATTYQWQVDSGSGWTDIAGANAASYTTVAATLSMDGYLYRCIVLGTAPCGSVTSNAVSLAVAIGPCLDQPTFSSLPTDWSQTNISYSGGEANFGANTGQLTTLAVSNPSVLTFDLRRTNNTTAKSLIVEISTTTQGGSYTQVMLYDHSNTTSNATTPITLDLSAYNAESTVFIRFRKASSTTSPWYLSAVSLTCGTVTTCTPQLLVNAVRPATASVNAAVQVEVNNSAWVDDVLVEGNSVPFTVINPTTIELIVPSASVGTAEILLVESTGCETATSVQIVSTTGTCSSLPASYSELFISEIYDSESNNVWNIELFNPTATPILLTGIYQIKRAADVSDPNTYTRIIDLVGTVPAYSVFTISAGTSGQTCNSVTFNMTESGSGINESDVIALFKNNVLVDEARGPNQVGYSLRRNVVSGETVPTATYTAAQWTINTSESCGNLGTFSSTFTSINASNPSDASGCASINFSISSSTGGVSYQWYFNDPATMTGWTAVNTTNLPGVTISGNTTATLSISGSVGALDGYQFYCIVTSGTCGKITNAARFQFSGQRYYRSINSGNWTTVANWQMSADKITYTAACNFPTSSNSSEVLIQSGTAIVLDADNAIDFLEIQPNATLEILPTSMLTVNDSTANADLIVNGTLLYRSNNVNSLTLDNAATWSLGGNATLIKTNSGSVTVLRDAYQGGIASITPSAQWIYRYNGDGNPTVTAINMVYPHLRFENTTASPYTTSISTNSFTGNSSSTVVLGNLEVGTTGTAAYTFANNNFNATPITVNGNFTIGAGSVFTNAPITDAGTGIDLKGNLTVDGTLTLSEGTTERILRLSGTSNQTISGTGTINVYKLEINKATGNVLLNRNVQAQNELKLMAGNVITNSFVLELGLSTAQKGTLSQASSFVIGKMKRWFDGTNATDATGLFPMAQDISGIKNRFVRVNYTTAPSAGGHLTVEFLPTPITGTGFPIAAATTGGFPFDVTNAANEGYWKIDNEAGKLTDGFYSIALTGEGFTTINTLSEITLIKRVGAGDWHCPGTHVAASGTTAVPTVSRTGVAGWSNFGFGGSAVNPLPVELIAFDARCADGKAEVNWLTASESNSERFVVESSRDLVQWSVIGELPAAGNSSSVRAYAFVDLESKQTLHYYRLTQVDFNGATTVYDPISLECATATAEITLYPNPNTGTFVVQLIASDKAQRINVQCVDQTGRVLDTQTHTVSAGENLLPIQINTLSMGMYWLRIALETNEIISLPFTIRQ